MKTALLYFVGAALCGLLSYLFAVVVRIPALTPPFALAGCVLLILGWLHFAKWMWALVVGGKR